MKNKFIQDMITHKIFDLTLLYQMKFPEIYENLLETPLFLTYSSGEISDEDLRNYYDSLKSLLSNFEREKSA
jgi:hypothetical protein